ncbi:hypothetical protein [Cronobacter sakazakii]|uniref:hypothetical protein n=1 Tax=Cronobacter sakazakii TaxID=28141 RepID=UPI00294B24FA|nr:hypothetical protein [Cronobacter sakazakii]
MNTAKLKAAALAAGGEEWAPRDQTKNYGEYTVIVKGSLETHSGCTSYRPIADGLVNKQVMKFIALANPAALLELIAALEAAKKTSASRLEAIDRTHKMYQREKERAESAEKRIAELEARKVKLPPCVDDLHGVGMVMAADAVTEALSAAGINLETGGE